MPFEEYNAFYNYISEHRGDTFPYYDELAAAIFDLGQLDERHAEYKNAQIGYENTQTLKRISDFRKKLGKVMDAISIYLDVYKSTKKDAAGTNITRMVRGLKTSLETEYTALRKVELEIAPELVRLQEEERERKEREAERQALQERLKEANPGMYNNPIDDSFNNSNEDISVEEPKPEVSEEVEEEEEIDLGVPHLPELNEMEKASRVLRNVGDAGIKPKLSSYQPKPGIGGRIWGSVKHYMFSALSLVAVPLNGLIYGAVAAYSLFKHGFRSKPAAVSAEHPYTGETEDEYQQTLKKVNDGDSNQPVLNDRRKIPQNYEVPIPEDPNQPPTFSVHVLQSQEGDQTTINAQGNTGHSFVSLKYTKINPETGKAERYMTSFGLYMKGGFGGALMKLASVGSGLYQPAQICDEAGKPSDVSVEYTINNKDVNKVILAAQQYEKGGYNTIERNCTNFAFDMGKAAGVDVEKYFHKANYTSDNVQWKLAAQPFFGFAASRLASDEMYVKSGRNDYSIQKFGKKMVEPEDIKHISSQSLNKEMYGYYPNGVAEAYRADRNTKLDSSIPRRGVSYNRSKYEIPRNAIQPFLIEIRAFTQSEHIEDAEAQIRNLEAYLIKRVEMIETITGNLSRPKAQTKENYMAASAVIKETVDDLNKIYKDSFKSRPELNIPFHQMIGAFNCIRDSLYYDYGKIKFNVNSIDQTLDASRALKKFYGQVSVISYDMRFSAYAAKLQSFGTAWNMMLFHADPDSPAASSPKGKKAIAEMEKIRSRGLLDSMEKAQHSYLEDREFNRNDYKQIFSEIPREEEKLFSNGAITKMYASNIYQNIALQRIFGGTKNELCNISLDQIDKDPHIIENRMGEILERKLSEKSHELTVLADGIADGFTEEHPRSTVQAESDWEYNELLKQHALERVMEAIQDNYAQPILDDIATAEAIARGWHTGKLSPAQKQHILDCYDSASVPMENLEAEIGKRIKERLDLRTYIKERAEIVSNGRIKNRDKAYELVTCNSEILARTDIQSDRAIIKEALAGLMTAELYLEYKEGAIDKGPSIKNYNKEVAKIKDKDFMDRAIEDPEVISSIKQLNSNNHDIRKRSFNTIVERMKTHLNPGLQPKQREEAQIVIQ